MVDGESDQYELKRVEPCKAHQSNSDPNEYVMDYIYKGEEGYNTFYHENYKSKAEECILLNLTGV